jgi:peptide/nickel transport system substrate-binding protein
MRSHQNRINLLLAVIIILAMVLSACSAPTVEPPKAAEPAKAPAAAEPTKAPAAEPTKAPAAAATKAPEPAKAAEKEDYTKAARNETVIVDNGSGKILAPDLWNPFVPGVRLDDGFHQTIMEPLFLNNLLSGKIEGWTGESFTANDKLDEWTLKIRKGVTWSDGKPFGADDVVFTIQLLINNAPSLSYSAAMKEWVKSVTKVDDLTVKFALNKPNPRFQLDYFSVKIWGSLNIMPKHIWDGQDPLKFKNFDKDKGLPIGTGPYKLVSANETEQVYIRDDNWWGAKTGWKPLPKPKKIIWTVAGTEEIRTAMAADNKLDYCDDISLGAWMALKGRNAKWIAFQKEMPYAHIEPTCTRTLEFNTTVEPWNDPEMRWAVNHAINREQVVKVAYEGTTVASRHYFPISAPLERLVDLAQKNGQYDKYPLTKFDQNLTKQIFEKKGWKKGSSGYYEKDGKQLKLTIQAHESYIELLRAAQVLVEQLQAVGINATEQTKAGGKWSDDLAFGNFEANMGWQTCGSVSEPWASMDNFNAKWLKPAGERQSANYWRWKNAEYSALVDQIGQLPIGDPKIDDLFLKANELFMKELPVIPVTQARKLTPFNTTYWTGWPTKEDGYASPTPWWQNFHAVIHKIQPTGAK